MNKARPFNKENVARTPDEPGVYLLVGTRGVVNYVGKSTTSIRDQLLEHLAVGKVPTTTFRHEVVREAGPRDQRERELVAEHTPDYNVAWTALDPLDKVVAHLDTSVRLANVLYNACQGPSSYATARGLPPPDLLRDVVQWSEADMLTLRHFGRRTLDELRKVLAQEGLQLRDPLARPCARRSCGELASADTKYCDEHRCEQPGCPAPRAKTCLSHALRRRVPDPLDKAVAHLRTSVRLANLLERAVRSPSAWVQRQDLPTPHTVRDLTQWCEDDLLRLPHMGKRLLRELVGLLEQEGAHLREPGAPILHTQTDQTLRATNDVVAAVRGLSVDAQIRVLKATCTVLDVDVELLEERKVRDVR